jgi:hypothetical protein
MKKYILVILCLFLFPPTFAQEKVNRKGKKALQFDFDGLKLSNPISGISGKYWWKDNLAIRAGLQFENLSYETVYEDPEKSDINGSDEKIVSFLNIEKHFHPIKKLSPYIGGVISYSLNNSVETQKLSGDDTELTDLNYSFGILFGIEYWLHNHISLSGHHILHYEYGLFENKNNYESSEYSRKYFESTTSKLILSIYF